MKRLFASLMLMLSFALVSAPLASASETSSFDVKEIFSIGGNDNAEESGVDGSFNLNTDLEDRESNDPTAQNSGGVIFALILRVINILTLFVGTFAFIMIIIGGFFFATATEESRIDKGKAILTQALVGLVIAFMSYFIVSFVQSLII